ncbi:YL1 nuclear protein-domain-containing protein [Lasiosphaeria miniovina]|uniref:YL1 nuclear protein-domain-containing protein n=1 Tax=Lasiosphaeria miniovina TaxID=1954250 RepID=A0AA40A4C8_9PEZI|nr:YL1 nuclear protein-domain-containing protein [Lasiosphaeria miniovina]KAK0709076.1 YL1 nuclear protein-domain-containing protein [Lasiosphaeria miniovina]
MATNDDDSKASARDELSDSLSSDESDNDNKTNNNDDDDGDSDTGGEPQQIEWLATTRARRSTAGNRLKAMLANEKPLAAVDDEDDLELLFAEDEDDAGFTDDAKEDASDVQMDSSSDEEDQGGAADDDLEGEKELERQAQEKKLAQRKRKANEAIPEKFRKRVRIKPPPTATGSASPSSATPVPSNPRPKKKSERLSWLPSTNDKPVRASERQTTKESKEQLLQKMVEDEVKRKKTQENAEKNAKRQEASKKPPMTQAERMQEAALVEKRNSKSLNRWEVAEKQREEERLRRIAALNNRKLDGPVVTFWSGIQKLEEGQQKHVGNLVSIEEKAPRKKRQPAAATLAAREAEKAKAGDTSKPPSPTETADPKPANAGLGFDATPEVVPVIKPEEAPDPLLPSYVPLSTAAEPPVPPPPVQITSTTNDAPQEPPAVAAVPSLNTSPPIPPPIDTKQPSAVLAAPILAPPFGATPPMLGGQMPMLGFSASNGKSNVLAHPNTSQGPSPFSLPATTSVINTPATPTPAPAPVSTPTPSVPKTPAPPSSSTSAPAAPPPLAPLTPLTPLTPFTTLQPTQGKAQPAPSGPDTPQETSAQPAREGKVTRSCIILQNFDENAIKDRQIQTQILFGRKMNKLAKPAHAPLCAITNHPAKYRDIKTGLPYANTYAYREIQRVYCGDYKFSRLAGAYVGSDNYAASGVPDRFLDPTKKRVEPALVPKEGDGVAKKEEETGPQTQELEGAPMEEPRLVPVLEPKAPVAFAVETTMPQTTIPRPQFAPIEQQPSMPPEFQNADERKGANPSALVA